MTGILAHGALGIWDELIYLAIAVIFIGFMAVSWLRSRSQQIETDTPAPPSDSAAPSSDSAAPSSAAPDRFKLE
jgi:hypothetical protein